MYTVQSRDLSHSITYLYAIIIIRKEGRKVEVYEKRPWNETLSRMTPLHISIILLCTGCMLIA